MKFTLSWLKQHLDTNADLTMICDTLTAIGLEVEGVEDRAKALAPFIVAEILEAEKHPDADRLRVCKVNTGKDVIQVVCGAPNARAGLKTVLARPGDVMPDNGEALKKGKIRGVESQGMMCSADELCLPPTGIDGIMELPADAPVGNSFVEFAQLGDAIIEINLTPNRPDCAGVRGIARDLAAAGLGTLKALPAKEIAGTEPSRVKVTLDFGGDNKACPLFVGRLIRNVKNGPSPAWLQQRLQAIGLRPISALVDITNLLTFDLGRPLHVFDAAKLKGNLRVYAAKGGETLEALNEKTYTLQSGMVVIGDDSGALSLGGIMGGASTGCDDATTDVFVEAALFDPARVAATGRVLQVNSDARYRFERGVDPEFTIPGMDYATQLILDLCSTPDTVVSVKEIAGAVPKRNLTLNFKTSQCRQRVGVDVPVAEQKKILTALGFAVADSADGFSVQPPSWRPDIEGTADLVEEIIRIKGYHTIEAVSLPRLQAITESAIDVSDVRAGAMRRSLAAQGLMESITWSFMPAGFAEKFAPVQDTLRLINPISADLDVMRPSVLGNLLQAAKRNADYGFADVGLFEIGPVFTDATDKGQVNLATMLRAGLTPRHWATPQRGVDVFDTKADVLAALTAAGAPVASLQITTDAPSYYHPGRSGVFRLGPTVLAYFGEIHPELCAAYDLSGAVVGAEIFYANIPASRSSGTAKPLLKRENLQPVARDFAFVVDRGVTAAKLIKAIRDADKAMIRDVNVFDVYEGEHVAADKKSVALSVTLQPTDKSLTDADLEAISKRITESVVKTTGATLRG